MAFSAAGKRVLITGASSGVGAALARALAFHGAVVDLKHADIDTYIAGASGMARP
jgi:NAD(P)-dependent dehydrogenase (short-subunit alcohol dehydrogenase family)